MRGKPVINGSLHGREAEAAPAPWWGKVTSLFRCSFGISASGLAWPVSGRFPGLKECSRCTPFWFRCLPALPLWLRDTPLSARAQETTPPQPPRASGHPICSWGSRGERLLAGERFFQETKVKTPPRGLFPGGSKAALARQDQSKRTFGSRPGKMGPVSRDSAVCNKKSSDRCTLRARSHFNHLLFQTLVWNGAGNECNIENGTGRMWSPATWRHQLSCLAAEFPAVPRRFASPQSRCR